MRKLGWMTGVVCALLPVLATEPTNAAPGGFHGSCFSTLVEFVSGQDIPESVTTDAAGNLYISLGNTIVERTSSGTLSTFATLPLPVFALGLKVGPDGCVHAASTSLSPDVPGAFVWRACAPGTAEVFAELDHSGAPNDLAFDDDGNLFVTDPVLGRVWKLDATGTPESLVEDPLLEGDPDDPALLFRALGANGIAFDRQQRFLYVSNTDQGSIVRIEVDSDVPSVEVFAEDAKLRGADGIAFDRAGTLYVAVNGLDALVAVDHQGDVELLAEGGELDSPSSLAFGATGATRHKLYVVSSAFMRTLGLKTGTPEPALLAARVAVPGLRLP